MDDGSGDATYPLMLELRAMDPRFKVIELSRNFGHQVAITAGLDVACGEAVMIMDGDLQHPPELLHEFIELWRQGYDIVYGVQTERAGQPWLKRTTARGFYRLLTTCTRISASPGAGDFRLDRRRRPRQSAAAFLSRPAPSHLGLYTDPTGKLFATLKTVGMPTDADP